MQDAVKELKMGQISKMLIDHDQKEVEIGALKKESFTEIQRSNDAVTARWQVNKELKDYAENRHDRRTVRITGPSRRAGVDKGDYKRRAFLNKEIILSLHSDIIVVLEGQDAKLVHELKTSKVNERRKS